MLASHLNPGIDHFSVLMLWHSGVMESISTCVLVHLLWKQIVFEGQCKHTRLYQHSLPDSKHVEKVLWRNGDTTLPSLAESLVKAPSNCVTYLSFVCLHWIESLWTTICDSNIYVLWITSGLYHGSGSIFLCSETGGGSKITEGRSAFWCFPFSLWPTAWWPWVLWALQNQWLASPVCFSCRIRQSHSKTFYRAKWSHWCLEWILGGLAMSLLLEWPLASQLVPWALVTPAVCLEEVVSTHNLAVPIFFGPCPAQCRPHLAESISQCLGGSLPSLCFLGWFRNDDT